MEIYKHTFVKKGKTCKIRIFEPDIKDHSPNATLRIGTEKYLFYVSKEMVEDEKVLIKYFKDFVNDLNKRK